MPRRPQLFTDVLATAPRPAAPPCTPRPVFTGATASIFPMALFLGGASHKALRHGVPASNTSATASLPLPPRRPGQQLPDGAPPRRTASSASATVPRPAAPPQRCPGQQHLRHCAPASNKPHPAEKSTPVWLAIWRTWAGFANSQLRRAAFRSIYLYRCAHSSCFHLGAAAQTDANLSAHLHRLPTPPPYLRQMRLSPGRVRGCWVLDETFASQGLRCWVANDAASCPCRSSCKSPRARILVLGTSGAHWPARWPRFELTERVDKS